ncbi:MAG: (Fe-S)-binding protein [Ruminococcus sp.]
MEYILPIGIFIVFGIVFGVLLTVISKVFAVKVDERAQKITETLPGANCGACGYAGCADIGCHREQRCFDECLSAGWCSCCI